jgi:hypothetical protein
MSRSPSCRPRTAYGTECHAESRALLLRVVTRAAAWHACLTSRWPLHQERSIAVRYGLQTKLPQTGRDQLVHQGGRERLVHRKVQRPFGALVTCEIGGQRRQD